MTRRRFLRATSLTLLILCLAAWGWSYVYDCRVFFDGTDQYIFQIAEGNVGVSRFPEVFGGLGWLYDIERVDLGDLSAFTLFGFRLWQDDLGSGLIFPLWFPTLLLATLTWWTWRKTRAKDGRGFAVDEVGEKASDATAKASEP